MGIKGLYQEIGHGNQVSLAKISIEHLEKTGKQFRLAIDSAIWQFQAQSGQGGKNPSLRTVYYRIINLLSIGIRPLFVFDGSERPCFKRNILRAHLESGPQNSQIKQLLDLFGLPWHDAPGEAEAECAFLQQAGIVDAVMSEDIDTLMFGCTMQIQNWTSISAGHKSPTHVNVLRAQDIFEKVKFDAHGMILIALMSGGDYDTVGVPKCGFRTACEAARAGFGTKLFDNQHKTAAWRQELQDELRTNQNKTFRQKHKAVILPENFPDPVIFGYYTSPAVSSKHDIAQMEINWNLPINITELRGFISETFGWRNISGAYKLIRTLSPALWVHESFQRSRQEELVSNHPDSTDTETNLDAQQANEIKHVHAIDSRRYHSNTDGCPELRITYTPLAVVALDLGLEENDFESQDRFVDDDKETLADVEEVGPSQPLSPQKRKHPLRYDPQKPEKMWTMETFVQLATPLIAENWEADLQYLKETASIKAAYTKQQGKGHSQQGAMHRFVKVTKAHRAFPESQRATDLRNVPLSNQLDAEKRIRINSRSPRKPKPIRPGKDDKQRYSIDVNPFTFTRRSKETHAPQSSTTGPDDADRARHLPSAQPQSSDPSLVTARPYHHDRLGIKVAKEDGQGQATHGPHGHPKSPQKPSAEQTIRSEKRRTRRLVALRESLEGSWKDADDGRALSSDVFKDIDVVDLTGDA